MADSFKEALIKAGVISKDNIEREKEKERREKIQRKGPEQHGVHMHHIRTDCANCGKTSPDVEFYEHTNRSITAKWLCIPCADKGWIKDDCRVTHQSSQAKSGMFRREFGATKKFPAGTGTSMPVGGSKAPSGGVPGANAGAPSGKPGSHVTNPGSKPATNFKAKPTSAAKVRK